MIGIQQVINDMKKNHSNSGFTLVELLVAIALFTIIVGVAVGGFTNALRTQRQVSSLIATQSNVSLALEQIAREIRTGYLFCHSGVPGSVTPDPSCGCVVSASNYTPVIPPAYPSEEINGNLPTWACNALDYYTAGGIHVHYSISGGSLLRDDGTGAQSITGDNVNVQTIKFILFGNIEGDNWTPRVTISLGVSPNSTDPATMNDVLNLQTTVSARLIDCTNASQC